MVFRGELFSITGDHKEHRVYPETEAEVGQDLRGRCIKSETDQCACAEASYHGQGHQENTADAQSRLRVDHVRPAKKNQSGIDQLQKIKNN